jgi:positive regulator of sigma E activity
MTETTRVMEVNGQEAVLGCITSSCSSCAGNSFCNVQGKTFTAINPKRFPIHAGDTVEVYLPPGKTIASGFMILMFPLLLFLAGLLGIRFFVPGSSEGLQALGGFLGMAVGFMIGYLFGRIKNASYQPVIVSLHGMEDTTT